MANINLPIEGEVTANGMTGIKVTCKSQGDTGVKGVAERIQSVGVWGSYLLGSI
jgi:hypothetical protein